MVLVSQTAFLNHNIAISNDTVLRVNCAWVKSEQELRDILDKITSFRVFLDLPTGRTKPPIPVLDFKIISGILEDYPNVEYFGLTNTTTISQIDECRDTLPFNVKIVPKIESELGVVNVSDICNMLTPYEKYLMLDKEDLYTDVKGDAVRFNTLLSVIKRDAQVHDKEILELKGVIFAT